MRASLCLVVTITVVLGLPSARANTETCFGQPATIVGTGGHDSLLGTDGNDVIVGRGWGDRISGLGGDDLICGGRGNDDLVGGPGNDRISGGNGGDSLDAGPLWRGSESDDGDDWLNGGRHDDSLWGTDGDDKIIGLGGIDSVLYYQDDAPGPVHVNLATEEATGWGADSVINIEQVYGTPFGDVLIGDGGANFITGAPIGQADGSDSIFAAGGDDEISDGIFGDDLIDAGAGDDAIEVGPGDEHVDGGPGTDTLDYAYTFEGVSGVTVDLAAGISTGQGTDLLAEIENVIGSHLNDVLNGSSAANELMGDSGDDTIDASDGVSGNDSVDGGFGVDGCTADPGDVVVDCES